MSEPTVSVPAPPTEADAHRRTVRKTPLGCGNAPGTSGKDHLAVQPGDHYTNISHRQAIHYACDAAVIAHWNPNQIRHSWATRITKEFGIEVASDGLGHSNIDTTELYVARSLERSVEIAKKVG